MVQTIRVGDGVYALLKHFSDKSKLPIKTLCNLVLISTLVETSSLNKVPEEIKKLLIEDYKESYKDVENHKSYDEMKNMTLKKFYDSLLP